MNRIVNIKIINPKLKEIKYASNEAAGVDLCACIDDAIIVQPGEIVKIPTGIQISANDTDKHPCCFLMFGRSGLGAKYGITLANSVGVIDSDYRGEIIAAIINNSNKAYIIEPMDRVAQLVLVPIERMNFNYVDDLDSTQRGTGGFGSTGK